MTSLLAEMRKICIYMDRKKDVCIIVRCEKDLRDEARRLGINTSEVLREFLQRVIIKIKRSRNEKYESEYSTTGEVDGFASLADTAWIKPSFRRSRSANQEADRSLSTARSSDPDDLEAVAGSDSLPQKTERAEIYFDELYSD